MIETRTLDLTGRTYAEPLPLVPYGSIAVDHVPHAHTVASGDPTCAGTRRAVDLVQVGDGFDHTSRWWVNLG